MSDTDTREQVTDDPTDRIGTVHLYPTHSPYRKGNPAFVGPGDIARCGHVKQQPSPTLPTASANCLMCIRLSELTR